MHSETDLTPKVSFQYSTTSSKRLLETDDGQTNISKFADLPTLEISMFSSITHSVKRINQIKPKPKLIIPQKSSAKSQSSRNSQSNTKSSTKQSLKYAAIKSPFFNWRKYIPTCGFQSKTGQDGCLCGNPCPLQKQWTKHYKESDFKLYQQLLNENILQSQKVQIQKDILRTHPDCLTFSKNQRFQQMLRQTLTSYAIYDSQVGYVQGMNLIVGSILYHIKNSELTFWEFVQLMDQKQLRMIYLDGFHALHQHEQAILLIMDNKVNDLVQKMNQLDIIPGSFLNGWILSLMGTCIPLEYMHEVIDKFRKYGWNYIYQLIITYLLFLKEELMKAYDQSEFLVNLNNKNSMQYGVVWEELVQAALEFPLDSQSLSNSRYG